ncbi:SatD family protein [Mesorhizobium sp. M0046]|uniref:hypothetical protein n=1 Tax=Mesorhizobium sp. M0046 TaxID=2956858 RepID=UPI00333A29B0
MSEIASEINPDFTIGADNKARWNQPDHRRYGFHNMHHLARYGLIFRAPRVMALHKRMDSSASQRWKRSAALRAGADR